MSYADPKDQYRLDHQQQAQQYVGTYDQQPTVQYTGVVYNDPPPNSPPPQLSYQPPAHQHAITPAPTMHIQPDPPPKALQPPTVTAAQVGNIYAGATMAMVPRLSSQDDFHHGMCGCCSDFFSCKNMNTCCCGTWCTCVLYSRIHHRLRARNPRDINGFSSCNGQCWASFCLGWAVHARQRDELRHRYRLNGSCCGDYWRHMCCGPCTLCQEEKELLYREEELETLMKTGNYQSGPQMMYPSQQKMQ